MCEDCPHVPPPVGAFCPQCGETIFAKDSGVILAGPAMFGGGCYDAYTPGPAIHRNCFFRLTFGSVAHVRKRCSCYVPGSTEHDDPALSPREAANQVAEALGYARDDAEAELICDFCAAREPLVRDIHAKNEIVTGYTSGAAVLDSGTWGACAECAALIDARDRQGLIERAVVGTMALDPNLSPEWEREYRERLRLMLTAVFGFQL